MSGIIQVTSDQTVDSLFDSMSEGQRQHMANKLAKAGVLPRKLYGGVSGPMGEPLAMSSVDDIIHELLDRGVVAHVVQMFTESNPGAVHAGYRMARKNYLPPASLTNEQLMAELSYRIN